MLKISTCFFSLYFLVNALSYEVFSAEYFSDPPPAAPISTSPKATNAPAVRVSTVKQVISDTLELANVIFSTGSNSFSFLPAPAWRLFRDDTNKQLTLNYNNGQKYIIVSLIETEKKDTYELKSENVVQFLKRKYPGLVVNEEYPVSAFNNSGIGYSIRLPSSGGNTRQMRHASIPFQGGLFEVTLVAATEDIESLHSEFMRLLLSLRHQTGPKVGIQKVIPE